MCLLPSVLLSHVSPNQYPFLWGNIWGTSPLQRACCCCCCSGCAAGGWGSAGTLVVFSLRAVFMLAARRLPPPAGPATVPLGILGSAGPPVAPATRPEVPVSPCSEARSLFMRVVTRTAFWRNSEVQNCKFEKRKSFIWRLNCDKRSNSVRSCKKASTWWSSSRTFHLALAKFFSIWAQTPSLMFLSEAAFPEILRKN